MVYKITVSPSAQTEIEEAIEYYAEYSIGTPLKFIKEIEEAYRILTINPYFRFRYKNYRAITLKGFPFILFYTIDPDSETIAIRACFHTAQNPKKYPG